MAGKRECHIAETEHTREAKTSQSGRVLSRLLSVFPPKGLRIEDLIMQNKPNPPRFWPKNQGLGQEQTQFPGRISQGLLLVAAVAFLSGCGREAVKSEGLGADRYATSAERASTFVWPEGKRAAVSLTFDDARLSQVDVGIPLLDRYRVKATFYVSPEPFQSRLPAWKQALANGHEIGNHSLRHPCTGNFAFAREKALEDYTLGQITQELEVANAVIESALGVRPTTFAYPCGQKFVGRGRNLQSYVPLVAAMFSAGRGWMDEAANDPAFCDPAQLLGMELDGLDFEQAKKLIDAAAKNGTWLVLAGHEIGESGRQTTRIDTLAAICEYARDPNNGIWIDTVENVTRHVRQTRQMRSFQIGDTAGGMPNSQDMNGVSAVIDLVDDAIGLEDDFSNGLVRPLRNGSIGERQFRCDFDASDDAIGKIGSSDRIVRGDVLNDLLEVFSGRARPDYLESHCFRLSFTSSWGITLPALISARPLSMPARKRTRSWISSHVAESGSS